MTIHVNPARMYREAAVRTATPVGLIVILYEEILRSLNSGLIGLRENNIERRTFALSHVLEIVGHLHSILDFERGGEVAMRLSDFYNVVRAKTLEANIKANDKIILWLIDEFTQSTEAWRQVDATVSGRAQPTAAAAVSLAALEPVGSGSPSAEW
jgi:flagellar secretion chaperone FliS